MIFDFHMHSSLSDGSVTMLEMGQQARLNGCKGFAITDHVGRGILLRIIEEATQDCALLQEEYGIIAIPGVEITHVPPSKINELAKQAKELGARLVVVHGETITQPIEPGTNRAAVESKYVDILAHPGLITLEEVEIAASNGIFLELSRRKEHCLCNGRVAEFAREKNARLLVNSDAHISGEILNEIEARKIALGSGLTSSEAEKALIVNPQILLKRIGITESF